MGRLEAKLVEIRGYHINWLSYFQNEVISKDDYELISKLDQLNPMQRNVALTKGSGKVWIEDMLCSAFCFIVNFLGFKDFLILASLFSLRNSLPSFLKSAENPNTCKHKIKENFFKKYKKRKMTYTSSTKILPHLSQPCFCRTNRVIY